MKHLKLFEEYTNEQIESLSDEDKDKISASFRKDFAVDNKFVFDDKLSDKQQEELLMKKLDAIIQKKNISGERSTKLKREWRTKIKRDGIKDFRKNIEQSYIANNPIARRASKLKRMIKDAIWKNTSPFWNDMQDLLAGNPY